MTNEELSDCANEAIRSTIREFCPGSSGSWMLLVPSKLACLQPAARWMDFLETVVTRYRGCIAPCTCPDAESFAGFESKQLIKLRDALVAATTCP